MLGPAHVSRRLKGGIANRERGGGQSGPRESRLGWQWVGLDAYLPVLLVVLIHTEDRLQLVADPIHHYLLLHLVRLQRKVIAVTYSQHFSLC